MPVEDGTGLPPSDGSAPLPEDSSNSGEPASSDPPTATSVSAEAPAPVPAGATPTPTPTPTPSSNVQTETVHIVLPTVYMTTTIPVVQTGFDWTLLTMVGAVAILISGILSVLKKVSSKKPNTEEADPCGDIKTRLEQKKSERGASMQGISFQESVIQTLRKKIEDKAMDVVKDKAKDVVLKKEDAKKKIITTADKAYETYEDVKENLESAEKLLEALLEKQAVLTREADGLEASYAVCIADLVRNASLPKKGMALTATGSKGKNALILHGTKNSSKNNWFLWLQGKLENQGWKVWVPNLPRADAPNVKRYNEFIFSSDWKFNEQSVLIGHSSGAVAILGLLQHLPENTVVAKAILVGAFKDDLGDTSLCGLFLEAFDFELLKKRAKEFILIHSDNDPYCPLDHATFLAEKLNGKLIVKHGEAHFSISTAGEKYKEFPELLALLEE